jgi:hypothetical protein
MCCGPSEVRETCDPGADAHASSQRCAPSRVPCHKRPMPCRPLCHRSSQCAAYVDRCCCPFRNGISIIRLAPITRRTYHSAGRYPIDAKLSVVPSFVSNRIVSAGTFGFQVCFEESVKQNRLAPFSCVSWNPPILCPLPCPALPSTLYHLLQATLTIKLSLFLACSFA